jgi:hypothetical protein
MAAACGGVLLLDVSDAPIEYLCYSVGGLDRA